MIATTASDDEQLGQLDRERNRLIRESDNGAQISHILCVDNGAMRDKTTQTKSFVV